MKDTVFPYIQTYLALFRPCHGTDNFVALGHLLSSEKLHLDNSGKYFGRTPRRRRPLETYNKRGRMAEGQRQRGGQWEEIQFQFTWPISHVIMVNRRDPSSERSDWNVLMDRTECLFIRLFPTININLCNRNGIGNIGSINWTVILSK